MTQPNTANVRRHVDRIGSALLALEIEMTSHCFVDENKEEVLALAERLLNLCTPAKGHLPEGMQAKEFKDAA